MFHSNDGKNFSISPKVAYACCNKSFLFTLFQLGSKMHSPDIYTLEKCLLASWYPVTSINLPLKPPREWDECMDQIGLMLRQRMPLQIGLLFLGSFISFLCLLSVLSIVLKCITPIDTKVIYILLKFTNRKSWYAS